MSKSRIKQIALKNAMRVWDVTHIDQLDPIVRLFIEVFSALINDNENAIEEIRERLLEQIANTLTPDTLISAKPAHAVMQVMPAEPEIEISRRDIFYTDYLTSLAKKYGLKNLNFAPVTDHIKLVQGEVKHIICEKNLYRTEMNGEKELLTKASSFYQHLNRTVWLGFDLSDEIKTLKNIHFYFDFPNTDHRHDLYDLLNHTTWVIGDDPVTVETNIANAYSDDELYGGIFSHYNISYRNDEEVMELYRKQFLHICSHIQTCYLKKTPFPPELTPFFPQRVNELAPVYWLKIVFPPHFKSEDLEDINISLNAFPVSNKNLNERVLERKKELVGILPLPVLAGEYFLSVDDVTDSTGNRYDFLPFSANATHTAHAGSGSYSLKRGGMERFSSRNLIDTLEYLTDLFRSDMVTLKAFKIEYLRNTIGDMEQILTLMNSKIEDVNFSTKELPSYLLIDARDVDNTIYGTYWISNCDIANNIPYGTKFSALRSISVKKSTPMLLKATSGGKPSAKNEERIEAYKYALTTRDQLYSISDIENFCRMKYTDKIQYVKVKRGVAISNNPKEGFIRTIDVHLVPSEEYRNVLFDPVKQGELKTELEKRSPELYNYRIIVLENMPY
ncbi:MAG: hypothetical protein LBV71_03875 [Prevotella sp.]|jgi:hypothetical protein|nr:hypothetical protein [Prevotella sp.]